MQPARIAEDGSIRWLRVLLVASIVAPALVFGASAFLEYRQTLDLAQTQVDRTSRIAEAHAVRALETSDLIIGRVADALGDRTDTVLRENEAALHDRLGAIASSVPQVEGVWVLDASGHIVASSRVFPADRTVDLTDRDYFRSAAAGTEAVLVTGLIEGRTTHSPFYTVSRRRTVDGRFAGVVGVALNPAYLDTFFIDLSREQAGLIILLYRDDGTVVMRTPPGTAANRVLAHDSPLMSWVRTDPPAQAHDIVGTDGERRIAAIHRVGGYPLLVAATMTYATIHREWLDKALITLGFTVAAMIALGAACTMALRTARSEDAVTREWKREAGRREVAEKALRESQRMEAMGQLTGGVAHDFNNLLMVVNGNLQILRKRLGTSAHDRQLEAIGRAIGRGATLTRHLLAFSRRQALQPRTIDLLELMPGLCELLSHSLREDVHLECNVEPDTWPIKADPAELELALLNIAVNARDAMPSGGTLAISARNATVDDLLKLAGEMAGEFVLITLQDTGDGVPAEALSRIFEPFFTTKPPGKGTGLGLSQVYGFTRQSGGTVTLQSPPGQGTTVTLWLPRSLEPPLSATEAQHRDPHALGGHILLVEDDASVAAVLSELLQQLRYEVTVTLSGLDALERLESGLAADVLLTDVVMTGELNGLQLARTVRARFPRLEILVMTGYAAEIGRIAGEGFTILTKPFDVDALADAVGRKVEGARAVRA